MIGRRAKHPSKWLLVTERCPVSASVVIDHLIGHQQGLCISTPLVVGGRVFVGSESGGLRCCEGAPGDNGQPPACSAPPQPPRTDGAMPSKGSAPHSLHHSITAATYGRSRNQKHAPPLGLGR